jgi:hypothetical protein
VCVWYTLVYMKNVCGAGVKVTTKYSKQQKENFIYKIQSAILVHYCTFGTGYNYPGVTYFTIYCVSHVKKITDLIKRLEDYGTYCYNCYSTCTLPLCIPVYLNGLFVM